MLKNVISKDCMYVLILSVILEENSHFHFFKIQYKANGTGYNSIITSIMSKPQFRHYFNKNQRLRRKNCLRMLLGKEWGLT